MNISGHGLREYLRLLTPSFALIAGVFILRLVLDTAGAPHGLVRVCSVTVAGAIAILAAAVLIHSRRFGGYSSLAVATLLVVGWQQLLIAGAIAFSALSGMQNIYSAPEYSPGPLGKPWSHIAGHLTFGVAFGELFGVAAGSLLLWILRKLAPAELAK